MPQPNLLEHWGDFLRRRGAEVAATTLAVLVATVLGLQVLPPHYTARTDVLLDPRRDKAFGPDDVAGTASLDAASVESAVAEIRGNDVLTRVVRSEKLAEDPRWNGTGRGEAGPLRWLSRLMGGRAARPTTPERYAAGSLFRALKVERAGKGYVLSISVSAADPGLVARLSNAVAAAFVADRRDARLEATRREAAFFAERLPPLGEHLRAAEDALDRFRQAHGLTATVTAGNTGAGRPGTLNEQQLGELTSRLAQARGDTAEAWARYDAARATVSGGGGMEAIPDVVRSPTIVQLRQQQAEVARREADLAARYSDAYPALVTVRAERREAERGLAREMARIVANLKGVYEIAKSREDGLKADVAAATGAAGLDNDLGRQLRDLERVRLVDQTVFETYLGRARTAEQQASFEERDARIVSFAVEPVVPAFPRTRIVLFCAALLGLGLGVALGLVLDALQPGFMSAPELEAATGLPVLAGIDRLRPRDRTVEGRLLGPARLLARRPNGRFAEAIHTLRAALDLDASPGCAVTLVASAQPGEGKTTLALSLAISAALAGRRVLVIDADTRNPALSRDLGLENRLGLVDMLSGLVGTAETTVPVGPNIALMPAGRRAANAADLFASPRLAVYVDHLRSRYDLVVIDAAPVEAGADAAVLARRVDRVLFVAGWRDTARAAVLRSLGRVAAPGRDMALVLNKIDGRKAPHYGAARQRGGGRAREVEA